MYTFSPPSVITGQQYTYICFPTSSASLSSLNNTLISFNFYHLNPKQQIYSICLTWDDNLSVTVSLVSLPPLFDFRPLSCSFPSLAIHPLLSFFLLIYPLHHIFALSHHSSITLQSQDLLLTLFRGWSRHEARLSVSPCIYLPWSSTDL